jgi:hypothetical protein
MTTGPASIRVKVLLSNRSSIQAFDLRQPIFDVQLLNTRLFGDGGGHKQFPDRVSVSGNQQVTP